MAIGKSWEGPRRCAKPRALAILGSAVLWLLGAASIAHAHGAMAGPDELGPPLTTAGALGFVCYWTVMLWPASKKPNGERKSDSSSSAADRSARPPRNKRPRKVLLRPRLRRVAKADTSRTGERSGKEGDRWTSGS